MRVEDLSLYARVVWIAYVQIFWKKHCHFFSRGCPDKMYVRVCPAQGPGPRPSPRVRARTGGGMGVLQELIIVQSSLSVIWSRLLPIAILLDIFGHREQVKAACSCSAETSKVKGQSWLINPLPEKYPCGKELSMIFWSVGISINELLLNTFGCFYSLGSDCSPCCRESNLCSFRVVIRGTAKLPSPFCDPKYR